MLSQYNHSIIFFKRQYSCNCFSDTNRGRVSEEQEQRRYSQICSWSAVRSDDVGVHRVFQAAASDHQVYLFFVRIAGIFAFIYVLSWRLISIDQFLIKKAFNTALLTSLRFYTNNLSVTVLMTAW